MAVHRRERAAMSLHVAGWVECKHPPSRWFDDDWVPVINLDPLLDDEQDLRYAAPFVDRVPEDGQRLALGHGLPDDMSAQHSSPTNEAGQASVPWYASWVTWAELKLLLKLLKSSESLPTDWRLVLAMVEPLAAVCGDEGVRLILWEYVTGYV
jgi:hypothetical protein